MINTVRVFVNGVLVPAIDPSAPGEGRDITDLVRPDGENKVVVEVSSTPDEAVIRVRDTGKGIKPENLARLGTPFFTTREGGTGLGVVLARAAIRQHGGDLLFESEVGRGTVATVRLPLHEAGAHG